MKLEKAIEKAAEHYGLGERVNMLAQVKREWVNADTYDYHQYNYPFAVDGDRVFVKGENGRIVELS